MSEQNKQEKHNAKYKANNKVISFWVPNEIMDEIKAKNINVRSLLFEYLKWDEAHNMWLKDMGDL